MKANRGSKSRDTGARLEEVQSDRKIEALSMRRAIPSLNTRRIFTLDIILEGSFLVIGPDVSV